ncbi:synaptic vesicular amine transporter-like [Lingula anatina]|uniref:Synaptic vesicular amine transporter-like n=1 Tax=Lingula anatina TaxID=7574 RepID=A0A1S3JZ98_LINAN|nr:synaptic vesicular amine transporter-like [Lingula anatina]|eukprot:XP_013415414.1 synaptic vesicular amine transporter-like [Lingula anatina]
MPLRKPGDIEQFELKPMPSENTAEKDSKQMGLWHRFRRSSALIIGVVFVALGLEVSLSTALDAILPCMLLESDTGEDCRTIQAGQTNFSLPTIDYTGEGGFVIGTKSIVEVFAKPLFGILIDSISFAFLNGFPMLMLSRAMQGVGCSLTTVAAIAMLAEAYTDVDERSRAMAKAFGGYAFGVIFGFPLGTLTYQFLGKEFPFLILAGINVLDAVFRLIIVVPEKLVEPSSYGAWSDFKELLVDPYIELGLGYTLMYTLSLGASLAIAPPWIMEEQFGMVWEIGAVFLIAGTLQFIIQFILGHITRKQCW